MAHTVARGGAQVCVELGGKTLIMRRKPPGDEPSSPKSIQPFEDFSSHNEWVINYLDFLYRGDLRAYYE